MKLTLKDFILRLIYLTPIGYILSLLSLISGDKTPGIYIELTPFWVFVKKDYLARDRFNWFFNGTILISQAFFVIFNSLGGNLGGAYAWIALTFGFVNITTAIHPKFNWNERIFKFLDITPIVILIILFLILATGYSYLTKFPLLFNKWLINSFN